MRKVIKDDKRIILICKDFGILHHRFYVRQVKLYNWSCIDTVSVAKMIDHAKAKVMLRKITQQCPRWKGRQNVDKCLGILRMVHSEDSRLSGLKYARNAPYAKFLLHHSGTSI